MSFKTKLAIFLLAMFITVAGLEVFVQATSANEVMRLARQAGDHRLFSIVAHAPVQHDLGSM